MEDLDTAEGLISVSVKQAKRFMLEHHGLSGKYKFIGKQGVLDYIAQAGCIQFDPIDICGKNAELTLQSRVRAFTKGTLYSILYEDRTLLDFFDKNLAIINTADRPYFKRFGDYFINQGDRLRALTPAMETIKGYIRENGPVCSSDLDLGSFNLRFPNVSWSNSSTLSREAMEFMYFMGVLVIHHKNGTRKFYDLAENCIPVEILSAPDPLPDDHEHNKWRVMRRIKSIGLLWNKASDAWLGINVKTADRNRIFRELLEEGKIIPIKVEGIEDKLFCPAEEEQNFISHAEEKSLRCELIAPLDNFMWDRKLIKALFDFDYKWEIYTPAAKRKYGYYTLPILYGQDFAGRAEIVRNNNEGTLVVKNVWFEPGFRRTKKFDKAFMECLERFAGFNGVTLNKEFTY